MIVTFTPIESQAQWDEVFLENMLRLNQNKFIDFISGEQTSKDIFKIGLLACNVGRPNFGIKELMVAVNTCNPDEQVEYNMELGSILLKLEKYKQAEFTFAQCITSLHKKNNPNPKLLKQCVKLKDLAMDEKLKKENGPKNDPQFSVIGKLYTNHELFMKRAKVIQYIIQSQDSKVYLNQDFASKFLTSTASCRQKCSVILSKFDSKGEEDLKLSVETIIDFILDFAPLILIKQFMSYRAIDKIVQKNVERFKRPSLPLRATRQNILEMSDFLHKDKNYYHFLVTTIECRIIELVKQFCFSKDNVRDSDTSDVDKSDETHSNAEIIVGFQDLRETCASILYVIDSTFEKNNLSKKEQERLKKMKTANESDKTFALEKVSTVFVISSIYTILCHKNYEIIEGSAIKNFLMNIKLEQFKKDAFEFKKCFLMTKKYNLNKIDPYLLKSGLIYTKEIALFSNLKTLKLSDKIDNKDPNFQIVNKIDAEILLSTYIEQLRISEIDNPINIRLLKRIIYCVLLSGGYHISVIWVLKRVLELLLINSNLSMISAEDGEDCMYSIAFSKYFDKFQCDFDIIIEKICSAQICIEVLNFTWERPGDIKQKCLHENGHRCLLPQAIINNNNEILFLPEYCTFIEDGNMLVKNLKSQFPGLFFGKTKSEETASFLKSILTLPRESLYECRKKSDALMEELLNGNILLLREIKRSHVARKILQDAAGPRTVVLVPQKTIDEEFANREKEKNVKTEDKEELVKNKVLEWVLENEKKEESAWKWSGVCTMNLTE